ncbi:MAG: methyltransferase [Pseudomonadota bacterium]
MARLLILLYGVVSYLIGVAGLVAIIVTLAGFMPWGFLLDSPSSATSPIIWNAGLVFLWGLIHTGMARQGFKDVLCKVVPEPAERSTYVLIAGITSVALVGYWQYIPGQVWHVTTPAAVMLLWGLFWFGWVFCLAATFAINHFDLFGLRQVFLNYRQMPKPPLNFVKRAMYRYIRHPIQTGVVIGVWATPSMSMTQLILSFGFTVYIFIGLWYEERDLVESIGQDYVDYKQETGKLFPRLFGR